MAISPQPLRLFLPTQASAFNLIPTCCLMMCHLSLNFFSETYCPLFFLKHATMSFPVRYPPLNTITYLQLNHHSFMIRHLKDFCPSFYESSSLHPIYSSQNPINPRSHPHTVPHIPYSKYLFVFPSIT